MPKFKPQLGKAKQISKPKKTYHTSYTEAHGGEPGDPGWHPTAYGTAVAQKTGVSGYGAGGKLTPADIKKAQELAKKKQFLATEVSTTQFHKTGARVAYGSKTKDLTHSQFAKLKTGEYFYQGGKLYVKGTLPTQVPKTIERRMEIGTPAVQQLMAKRYKEEPEVFKEAGIQIVETQIPKEVEPKQVGVPPSEIRLPQKETKIWDVEKQEVVEKPWYKQWVPPKLRTIWETERAESLAEKGGFAAKVSAIGVGAGAAGRALWRAFLQESREPTTTEEIYKKLKSIKKEDIAPAVFGLGYDVGQAIKERPFTTAGEIAFYVAASKGIGKLLSTKTAAQLSIPSKKLDILTLTPTSARATRVALHKPFIQTKPLTAKQLIASIHKTPTPSKALVTTRQISSIKLYYDPASKLSPLITGTISGMERVSRIGAKVGKIKGEVGFGLEKAYVTTRHLTQKQKQIWKKQIKTLTMPVTIPTTYVTKKVKGLYGITTTKAIVVGTKTKKGVGIAVEKTKVLVKKPKEFSTQLTKKQDKLLNQLIYRPISEAYVGVTTKAKYPFQITGRKIKDVGLKLKTKGVKGIRVLEYGALQPYYTSKFWTKYIGAKAKWTAKKIKKRRRLLGLDIQTEFEMPYRYVRGGIRKEALLLKEKALAKGWKVESIVKGFKGKVKKGLLPIKKEISYLMGGILQTQEQIGYSFERAGYRVWKTKKRIGKRVEPISRRVKAFDKLIKSIEISPTTTIDKPFYIPTRPFLFAISPPPIKRFWKKMYEPKLYTFEKRIGKVGLYKKVPIKEYVGKKQIAKWTKNYEKYMNQLRKKRISTLIDQVSVRKEPISKVLKETKRLPRDLQKVVGGGRRAELYKAKTKDIISTLEKIKPTPTKHIPLWTTQIPKVIKTKDLFGFKQQLTKAHKLESGLSTFPRAKILEETPDYFRFRITPERHYLVKQKPKAIIKAEREAYKRIAKVGRYAEKPLPKSLVEKIKEPRISKKAELEIIKREARVGRYKLKELPQITTQPRKPYVSEPLIKPPYKTTIREAQKLPKDLQKIMKGAKKPQVATQDLIKSLSGFKKKMLRRKIRKIIIEILPKKTRVVKKKPKPKRLKDIVPTTIEKGARVSGGLVLIQKQILKPPKVEAWTATISPEIKGISKTLTKAYPKRPSRFILLPILRREELEKTLMKEHLFKSIGQKVLVDVKIAHKVGVAMQSKVKTLLQVLPRTKQKVRTRLGLGMGVIPTLKLKPFIAQQQALKLGTKQFYRQLTKQVQVTVPVPPPPPPPILFPKLKWFKKRKPRRIRRPKRRVKLPSAYTPTLLGKAIGLYLPKLPPKGLKYGIGIRPPVAEIEFPYYKTKKKGLIKEKKLLKSIFGM